MQLDQPKTEAGRVSQVQEQLENLEKLSAILSSQVEQLEGRLSRVLLIQNEKEIKPAPPEPVLCQLGSDLREQFHSLSGTSSRLRGILERLEL